MRNSCVIASENKWWRPAELFDKAGVTLTDQLSPGTSLMREPWIVLNKYKIKHLPWYVPLSLIVPEAMSMHLPSFRMCDAPYIGHNALMHAYCSICNVKHFEQIWNAQLDLIDQPSYSSRFAKFQIRLWAHMVKVQLLVRDLLKRT